MIDQHDCWVSIDGTPVQVIDAETTLDRAWAPYVQGKLTVVSPGSLSVAEVSELHAGLTVAQASGLHAGQSVAVMSAAYRTGWQGPSISSKIDPRRRMPITVRHGRRFSGSETVAEVSARFARRTVAQFSTAHAGLPVEQASARYRTPWNGPDGPAGTVTPLDAVGWITAARRRRTAPHLWEIEWAGREVQAIAQYGTSTVPAIATTVRGIVAATLTRAGLGTLAPGTADAPVPVGDDGQRPAWVPPQSVWEYLDPIVTAAGTLRLYADEAGVWRLVDDTAPAGACTLGPGAIECEDDWAIENDRWFDHAVIVYEWEDDTGTVRREIDAYAEGAVHGYRETVQGRISQYGRARQIVQRARMRAFEQRWEIVADPTIRPGQTATISQTGQTGTVTAHTLTWPDARSTVSLIDITQI